MLEFLQQDRPLKKIIPSAEVLKEKIEIHEDRLGNWLDMMARTVLDYTPRIISGLLVLFIGMWLITRIARLAEKAMGRRELEISLRTFLKSLISIGLKIVLIVTVAGMVGVGTASFVTILGAAGLAVGLALQGSLSNFAGGVLILIFKPFKVGDTIEAGGQSGTVTEIQIFNTILLTGEHKTVILPNGPLSNGTIVNVSRHGDLRVDIQLTVSSDNDLDALREQVMITLNSHPKILTNPAPAIFIGTISQGAVNITLQAYCLQGEAGTLRSELYAQMKTLFEREGIRPAIQERIIHNIKAN